MTDTVKLPELDTECGTCQGSGIVTTPEWLEWDKAEREAKEQWEAQHSGGNWPTSAVGERLLAMQPDVAEMDCGDCGGKGVTLTPDGRLLLSFLSRHGRR